MVFNSVLVLSQLLGEKYNVALLLLCTYEKTWKKQTVFTLFSVSSGVSWEGGEGPATTVQ